MASLARVASSSVAFPLRARAFTAAAGEPMERIPSLRNAQELLEFSSNNIEQLNPAQLSWLIRSVPRHMGNMQFDEAQAIRRSDKFQVLFNHAVESAQTNGDVFESLCLFKNLMACNDRFIPANLKEAVHELMASVISRRVVMPAACLPDFLNLLLRLDVRDLALCSFVREELPKAISVFSPAQCRIVLSSISHLQIRESEIVRPLVKKMEEGLDQFKNSDVLSCLRLFADTGLRSSRIQSHCVALLGKHASLFPAKELVVAGNCFLRMQEFRPVVARPLIMEIKNKKSSLKLDSQIECLQLLTHANWIERDFANELMGNLASSAKTKTPYAMARMAHSICYFNLTERVALLEQLILDLMALETRTTAVVELMNETLESCRLDMDFKITPSESYKLELENFLSTPAKVPVSFIKEQMEYLPKSHQFNFEESVMVGSLKPTFVDHNVKVVFDVETTGATHATGFALRRSIYDKLGYSYARMPMQSLRRLPEETKWEAIRVALDGVAIKLGRISEEEVQAARKTAFNARQEARASMIGSR